MDFLNRLLTIIVSKLVQLLLPLLPLILLVASQDCLRPANDADGQLPAFRNLRSIIRDGNPAQMIATSYQFQCCGNITNWLAQVFPNGQNHNELHNIDFQVWRPSSTVSSDGAGEYSLVGVNSFTSINILNDRIVNETPEPSNVISVRPGDVVGYHQLYTTGRSDAGIQIDPEYSNSRLLWYQVDPSPVDSGIFQLDPRINRMASTNAGPIISLSMVIYSCLPATSTVAVTTTTVAVVPQPTTTHVLLQPTTTTLNVTPQPTTVAVTPKPTTTAAVAPQPTTTVAVPSQSTTAMAQPTSTLAPVPTATSMSSHESTSSMDSNRSGNVSAANAELPFTEVVAGGVAGGVVILIAMTIAIVLLFCLRRTHTNKAGKGRKNTTDGSVISNSIEIHGTDDMLMKSNECYGTAPGDQQLETYYSIIPPDHENLYEEPSDVTATAVSSSKSHDTTNKSCDTTSKSHDTTSKSHDTADSAIEMSTNASYGKLTESQRMRDSNAYYSTPETISARVGGRQERMMSEDDNYVEMH